MSQVEPSLKSSKMALIALGANLPSAVGGPKSTVTQALAALDAAGLQIIAKSKLYVTPCFPAGYGPDYVNAVVAVDKPATPLTVLKILHNIEAHFGRTRETRWGGRVLDLDLLAVDDLILPDLETYSTWQTLPAKDQVKATPDQLILPHPRIQDRPFVLVPLMDVAPDWRHPILGKTIRELHAGISPQELSEIVETDWGDEA